MPTVTLARRLTPLILAAGHAVAASSQVRAARPSGSSWSDSTPAKIISLAQTSFPRTIVVDVLRQTTTPRTGGTRAELLDRSSAFAVDRGTAPMLAIDAVGAIALAGSRSTDLPGTPEPAALDHLIRIHRDAPSRDVRVAALGMVDRQVNPYRAVPYLRAVATSPNDDTAILALDQLNGLAVDRTLGTAADRSQAESVLRSLWDESAVRSSGFSHTNVRAGRCPTLAQAPRGASLLRDVTRRSMASGAQ